MTERRVALFRKGLALYLLYYYAYFLTDLTSIFGAHGVVAREFLHQKGPSLFFLMPWDFVIRIALVALVALTILFFLGKLDWKGVLALFVLNLSFHNANPYIHGEPQALQSLFLFAFFFLPSTDGVKADEFYVKALTIFLGVYYLIAGLKKLPDPLWRSGQAVGALARWDGITADTFVSHLVGGSAALGMLATYGTILFELTFLALLFTRFRPWIVAIGIAFHAAVALTLQVGTFSALMFVWYLLLIPGEWLDYSRSIAARVWKKSAY